MRGRGTGGAIASRYTRSLSLLPSDLKIDREEEEQYWCVFLDTTSASLISKSDARCQTD